MNNGAPRVWAYVLLRPPRNGYSRTPEHASDALAGPLWTETRGRGRWAPEGDSGQEGSSDA